MTIKLHFWYDYSKFFHLFSFCFIAIVNLIVRWNYKCLAMLFFSCIPALHWATAHKIFLPLKIRSKWFSWLTILKPNAWSEEQKVDHHDIGIKKVLVFYHKDTKLKREFGHNCFAFLFRTSVWYNQLALYKDVNLFIRMSTFVCSTVPCYSSSLEKTQHNSPGSANHWIKPAIV